MNVGTVEATLAVDATDLDKLPAQARAAMLRAQQEFEKASKSISEAFKSAGSGLVDAFGKPVESVAAAVKKVDDASKKAGDGLGFFSGMAKQLRENLASLGPSAQHVAEVFSGVSLANAFTQVLHVVKDLAVEMVHLGAEARLQEESFRLLATQVGASAEA